MVRHPEFQEIESIRFFPETGELVFFYVGGEKQEKIENCSEIKWDSPINILDERINREYTFVNFGEPYPTGGWNPDTGIFKIHKEYL